MSRLLTGILLFASTFFCSSQILRFDQYTTRNGLLSDQDYSIHQDNKGYVWIFSNYGTIKYNGSEFRQVLKNLHLNESFVYSFYERADGKQWFANSKAMVYEIVNDSAKLIPGLEAVSAQLRKQVNEIFQIYVDGLDNIYLITKRESYVCTKTKDGYRAQSINGFDKQADYGIFLK